MSPIFSVITQLGISLSIIILLPVGIIVGIVFGVKASGEKDAMLKKKNKKIMWWSISVPFLVILFLLIVGGLLSAISAFIK